MNAELRTIDHIKQTAITLAMQFGPKVLVAIGLMIAGALCAKWLGEIFDRTLNRFHLEPPVRHLLVRVMRILVLALFAIMALENMGVQLLPLIAGLGVAGAGVALAMQGVLGNIMAGLTIIFTKPYRVGEYVSIAGEEGQVQAITLSNTILSHNDLSQVVVPNRKIVGEILHNYGRIRQLEIVVRVAADADLNRAIAALTGVVCDNPRCLPEPVPPVTVSGFADGGICLTAKPWVAVPDYMAAGGEIRKALIEAFRAAHIATPPPLREMHLVRDTGRA